MAQWLLKTEPECYSWDDLVRDKKAVWDGITNALALKHLRTIKKGDIAVIYHTGDQRSVIGTAEIISAPYPDPKQEDEKLAVVDLKPKHKLPRPVTISDIKADPVFADWVFIRNGRLSVVPIPDKMWKRIEELASEE
jgi:predicted RNA-binding protein with PUA-like domain